MNKEEPNFNIKPAAPKNPNIKVINTILTLDLKCGAVYQYLPPYNHKNAPKVKRSEQIEHKYAAERGFVVFDYDENDKLCGIEITNGSMIGLVIPDKQ